MNAKFKHIREYARRHKDDEFVYPFGKDQSYGWIFQVYSGGSQLTVCREGKIRGVYSPFASFVFDTEGEVRVISCDPQKGYADYDNPHYVNDEDELLGSPVWKKINYGKVVSSVLRDLLQPIAVLQN